LFTHITPKTLSSAEIRHINKYFLCDTIAIPADIGLALGTQAANIQNPMCETIGQHYLTGHFNQIILSGAPLIEKSGLSEAEEMADYLRKHKIPSSALILDNDATNTQENIEIARKITQSISMPINTVFCFGNVYGGRRILMTIAKRWPEITPALLLTAPRPDFKDTWQDHTADRERMCWEFNKIAPYTQKGWLTEVNIDAINLKLRIAPRHRQQSNAPHMP